ncbi:MAG: hypothetical protein H7841_07835 [Magnetospirillum sp. WYHS-4]
MRKHILLFVAALIAGPVLTACQTPPTQRFPEISFANLHPINLEVASVKVASRFQPTFQAPNVEHQFPIQPQAALQRWAQDRLKSMPGGRDGATFTIVDASVKEVQLETDKDLKAKFTKEQSQRYELRLEAIVEVFDGRGLSAGHAQAAVVRTKTVREDSSLNDREKVWYEMTEAAMNDFNAEMEKNIRQYLRTWAR